MREDQEIDARARGKAEGIAIGIAVAQAALAEMRRYCFDRTPERTVRRAELLQTKLDAVSALHGLEPGHAWTQTALDQTRKDLADELGRVAAHASASLEDLVGQGADPMVCTAVSQALDLLGRAAVAGARGCDMALQPDA